MLDIEVIVLLVFCLISPFGAEYFISFSRFKESLNKVMKFLNIFICNEHSVSLDCRDKQQQKPCVILYL